MRRALSCCLLSLLAGTAALAHFQATGPAQPVQGPSGTAVIAGTVLDERHVPVARAQVQAFSAEDKPIAAICHAVQILTAADVLRGRRVSGYAACAPEVRLAGGEYVETPPDGAIRDGNLVTGFAWPAHPQWLSLFLAALGARVDIG